MTSDLLQIDPPIAVRLPVTEATAAMKLAEPRTVRSACGKVIWRSTCPRNGHIGRVDRRADTCPICRDIVQQTGSARSSSYAYQRPASGTNSLHFVYLGRTTVAHFLISEDVFSRQLRPPRRAVDDSIRRWIQPHKHRRCNQLRSRSVIGHIIEDILYLKPQLQRLLFIGPERLRKIRIHTPYRILPKPISSDIPELTSSRDSEHSSLSSRQEERLRPG